MILLWSSEKENDINDEYSLIHGSVWKEMQIAATPGRALFNNIFKKEPSSKGYPKHKFDVVMTDQITRKYTTISKCRSRIVQVFLNILDLARINTWILYKET